MYCIIDIETTGGSAIRDRITEIAIYRHNGLQIIDELVTLVNPEVPIPYYITQMTGISNEMVANAPRFFEIARKVVELTDGAIFVAHNAQFDYGFVVQEFKRLGYDYSRDRLCTVRLARKLIPGHKSYSLENICSAMGIEIDSRHRAAGDAMATVRLFELLLRSNRGDFTANNSNKRRVIKRNSNLGDEIIDQLPEGTGVYYFYDSNETLLYVGKSKNIRARVIQHLSESTSNRSAEIAARIARVDFELTGSELLALIRESEQIKSLMPVYNRLGRRSINTYGIFAGENELGYKTLGIAKLTGRTETPFASFSRIEDARNALFRVIDDYTLCQKMSGFYASDGPCFLRQIRKCRGACQGIELPETYNQRVDRAIERFSNLSGSFILFDKGRNDDEKSFVKVINGKAVGYGYFSPEYCGNDIELISESARPCKNHLDIIQAINRRLRTVKREAIVYL